MSPQGEGLPTPAPDPPKAGPGPGPVPAPLPAAVGTDWRLLRLWQIQPIRDALVLLSVIGLIYLGNVLSLVTVPLLLALALAYLVEPLVRRFTRSGRVSRQGAAVGIVLAGVLVIVPVVVAAGFGTLQAASYAQRVGINVQQLITALNKPEDPAARATLPASWQRIADRIIEVQQRARAASATIEKSRPPAAAPAQSPDSPAAPAAPASTPAALDAPPHFTGELDPALINAPGLTDQDRRAMQLASAVRLVLGWLRDNAESISRRILATGADVFTALFGVVISLAQLAFGAFLTAFFFYFFCIGYGRVLSFWERLIPERRKGRIIDLLSQMDAVISAFIRGRLIICGVLVVFYTLAYWLVGLHAWLILGPLVGILTLVPYAAGLIGIPVGILLMWLEPPDSGWQATWWWMSFAPMLVAGAQQMLDDYLLTPRIQGDATGMDVPTILFASVAGGILAGFYGVLLAIPVAACIKILLREVVLPQVKDWAEGKARDPLPISRS